MREIKFRAWDIKQGAFIAGFNMVNFHSYYNAGMEPEIYRYNTTWKLSEIILMQYTGIKDKAGKGSELFDGDLIVNDSRNAGKAHPIKWSDTKGAWVGDYGTEYLIAQELHEITKVGNIYENPELLQ